MRDGPEGALMGLFSRAFRNIRRVVSDVGQVAQVVAPIALPLIGGALAGQLVSRLLPQPSQLPEMAAATVAATRCPPAGVVRGGFSAPFQSRNFSSGGSLAARAASTFLARPALGRNVTGRRAPPMIPAGCPSMAARRFIVPGFRRF